MENQNDIEDNLLNIRFCSILAMREMRNYKVVTKKEQRHFYSALRSPAGLSGLVSPMEPYSSCLQTFFAGYFSFHL